MRYLNDWLPFESNRFDLVKITMWRCLVLQIWEQQKQLLRQKQRVIQQVEIPLCLYILPRYVTLTTVYVW